MDSHKLSRYSIQVSGSVQRVGYRHIVQNIARKFNITGCIENLEGYDVHIIAEGREEDLDTFIQAIKIVEYPVYVDEISTEKGEYTGDFSYFQVIIGSPYEELEERFDTALAIFSRMEKKQDIALEKHEKSISLQEETIDLQKKTVNLQEKTISLQEKTIGLQEKTISLQEKTIGLQEKTVNLQEETIDLQKETLTEVKGMRSDLDNHLNKEISEMRIELKEIRTALINYGIMTAVKS